MHVVADDWALLDAATLSRAYWNAAPYPTWCPQLNVMRLVESSGPGWGPEPHFHDVSEYWLFCGGYGEVTLGDSKHLFDAGACAFTPAGVTHAFKTYAQTTVVAVVGRVGSRSRRGHLWPTSFAESLRIGGVAGEVPDGVLVVEDPPKPTASGAFVSGSANEGPLPWRNGELDELRLVTASDVAMHDEAVRSEETTIVLCVRGSCEIALQSAKLSLNEGDAVIIRLGATYGMKVAAHAILAVAKLRLAAEGGEHVGPRRTA